MTENLHCYTSFTFAYLARARVLAQTVKEHHPNWTLWAIISDKPPKGFTVNPDKEDFDHIIYIDELDIPDLDAWLFKHNIIETCTAVKGQFLKYLLDQGAEKIIYLDPDIAILNPLDEIAELLNNHAVLLTPHQLTPDIHKSAIIDNEICSLKHGVYNLGFLAINNSEQGRSCADWWNERLQEFCYDDIANGIFTDQKWCDLIPSFFHNHHIIHDPGCNVASWNLSQRNIEILTDGRILVNGSPLKFFHFTKLGPTGDIMTIRYAGDNLAVYELWAWYKQLVINFEETAISPNYWHYSTFDNGEYIPNYARSLYRTRIDLQRVFPSPLTTGPDSFYEWLDLTGSAPYQGLRENSCD